MTKILLVEDDKSLREIYGVRLLAEGYDIVSAGDGEEALAMAIKEKPTLIISDVMMPKISGFDMLDILRSTTETRDIRVIMMTALSSDDQRIRGEQLGADRYLVKSQVGIEDVVRTVHEVLEDNSGASTSEATPAPTAPADAPATEPVVSTPEITPAEPVAPAPSPAEEAPSPAPTPEFASEPTTPPVVEQLEESGPGPLPPQPSENLAESAPAVLPQPTAPFSSPRPTNLGERVISPIGEQEESTGLSPEIGDQIAKELQASAEPVTSTQVDDAISDADVEPKAEAPVTPAPSFGPVAPQTPDFSTPTSTENTTASELPPISLPPTEEKPPTISGTSTPVS